MINKILIPTDFSISSRHAFGFAVDLNKLFKVRFAKDLSLVLNIDNLLDKEVWLPIQVQPIGGAIPYNQGRTIYGGFKAAF